MVSNADGDAEALDGSVGALGEVAQAGAACWYGLKGNKLSAAFWLVFGQGMSVPDAIAMVDDAPGLLIGVWARNGSRSWRNFETFLLREIDTAQPSAARTE